MVVKITGWLQIALKAPDWEQTRFFRNLWLHSERLKEMGFVLEFFQETEEGLSSTGVGGGQTSGDPIRDDAASTG